MNLRAASLLFALALPLAAQDPAAAEAEAMFYKAYYLERGPRDFAGAMTLYEQFLAKAADHKLASEAAGRQFSLLNATGKTKERDAFKAKYEKLLGNAANAPAPAAGDGDRPARGGDGERRGGGAGAGGPGGRGDMAARITELEKQLEKAKADGNAEEQKRLEGEIARMRQGGRGGAAGGPGGAGGNRGRGGLMAAMNKKVAEMTAEELTSLKDGLGNATRLVDMVKQSDEEKGKRLETNIASLKKALEANNLEDAQKAIDAIKPDMPTFGGRRGGGGGGEAGGGGGRGGEGGGGNRGGGGGNGGGGR
jgi:hypothetical protein